MGRYTETDIRITEDGDLVIEDGDFALVSDAEATGQNLMCRLKSSDPEWFQESICANLEDLLGLPNNQETGEKGEGLIRKALTTDDLISIEDLYVQAVPINKSTMVFYVYFKAGEEDTTLGYEIELNLSAGAKIRRVS